jgi:hypothetical protein
MAKLSYQRRKHMPKKEFAEPGKRAFPIPDISHGRNALARAAHKPPAERAKISTAVHRKFPSIGAGKKIKRTVRRSRSRA